MLLVFPDENKFPLVKHAVWTAFIKIPPKLTPRRSFENRSVECYYYNYLYIIWLLLLLLLWSMMILIIGFTCPATTVITKCAAFLLQSATSVITKCDIRITKCDRTPSCLRYFFFFSGFILVLRTRLAEFILETNYLSRRIIRLEFDENLCRYFTRVAKI